MVSVDVGAQVGEQRLGLGEGRRRLEGHVVGQLAEFLDREVLHRRRCEELDQLHVRGHVLRVLEDELREQRPEIFKNQNRLKPSMVEGGSSKSSSSTDNQSVEAFKRSLSEAERFGMKALINDVLFKKIYEIGSQIGNIYIILNDLNKCVLLRE